MERLFEALRPFVRWIVRHPGQVLAIATLFSLVGLYFALHLRIDTDFAKLLPADHPNVQALERLRQTVGGESSVDVIIESPSFEANKRFAEALIPQAMQLKYPETGEPYFTRYEYTKDSSEIAFIERNALYFATEEELDKIERFLEEQIEKARLEANPFYIDLELEEDQPSDTFDAEDLRQLARRIIPKAYPISDDSTLMVIRFYPSGSQTNLKFIESLYRDLEQTVQHLQPAHYHPQMHVYLGGAFKRQLIEIRSITEDVYNSFAAGVTAVLLLVTLYFFYKSYRARTGGRLNTRLLLTELLRMPITALVIGLPLLMSLAWTFGFAYLAFHTLNLMTSTLGLVLFGLGIDYGIHFYARYAEERGQGRTVGEAIEITFISSGPAITVSALTTATALYVLMLAKFRGFSEFGAIAGTGILFALVAMMVVLPALVVLLERYKLLNLESYYATPFTDTRSSRRFPAARTIVLISLVAVILSILYLPRLSFEFDFGALEPRFETYEQLKAKVSKVYPPAGRNPAYILVDSPEEVPEVMEALRHKMQADTLSPTIKSIESLQARFPLDSLAQQRKLKKIARIRTLLEDPFLKAKRSEALDLLRKATSTQEPIPIEQLPRFLQRRFLTKSGEIGHYIMVYPSVRLADGRLSMQFAEDVGKIVTASGKTYYAASSSIVAAEMLRLMLEEAPWMIGLTFLSIILLMLIVFRSVRWALLALLPLIVGLLWMFGIMELLGLKLNFYNLVVLPAILGIGNDSGVHIVHRYREEGPGSIMRVLRSTGEHVTMGALTTMIGFAGLLLSYHPGLRSIGELAVVGIGATLLAALLFLPALLQWLEDAGLLPQQSFHPSKKPSAT